MSRLLFAAATAACAYAQGGGLRDIPVGADVLQYLSGPDGYKWTASNAQLDLSLPASVPGGLVSDLQRNGIISDPFYELGWLNSTAPWQGLPLWNIPNWTYATSFTLSPQAAALCAGGGSLTLVLDGVKMAASVYIGSAWLGDATDQFLRMTYPLNASVLPAAACSGSAPVTVSLVFGDGGDSRNNEGRFSGASGGWDWGPYTNVFNSAQRVGATSAGQDMPSASGGAHQGVFSLGPWRDVYLAASAPSSALIKHVAPRIYYTGQYALAPLTDAAAGPWLVSVGVQLSAAAASSGTVTVTGSWAGATPTSTPVTLAAGDTMVTVNVTVPVGAVQLWWPNGYGSQTLYNLTVTFTPASAAAAAAAAGPASVTSSRSIGFRFIALVTADDSNPAALRGVDGSGNLTMRLRVNGANLWMRGADIIPLEVLDGRSTRAAMAGMLASAVAAHFTMIRIDGIDTYLPDAFYSLCDEYGILIYHDAQYSQGNVAPAVTPLQDAEIRHTARRLAHHPSLAIYDSCNECGGHGIYASFVATTFAEEDPSRPIWPSSPSAGWISGVDRLTGLPNGSPLGLQPHDAAADDDAAAPKPAIEWQRSRTASAAPTGGGNCSFIQGYDICPGDPLCLQQPHPAAATPQDCCDACAAAGSGVCGSAVFYDGVCWFKPANYSQLVYSPGRVLCWPSSRPPPTPPAPGPMPPGSIEQHGPYQHGTGYPAVNGDPSMELFDANIPPALSPPFLMGPTYQGLFVSEYGCVGPSSFESLSPTLNASHWGIHGGAPPDTCNGGFERNCSGTDGKPTNVMAQRNYPIDNLLTVMYGAGIQPSLDDVGAAALQRQVYLGMLATALQQKSHAEAWRSAPVWATLYWQLNEIWPTLGSWGSVEYTLAPADDGFVFTAGQVGGGRWKPLHYWLAGQLFTDVIVACGADGRCYARNDSPFSGVNGTLLTVAVPTTGGAPVTLGSQAIALLPGAAAISWGCVSGAPAPVSGACMPLATLLSAAGCAANGTDCILQSTLFDAHNSSHVLASNWQLLAPPGNLTYSRSLSVTAAVGALSPDGTSIPITLSVSGAAGDGAVLMVVLTTQAQGRFSDNALPLLAAGSSVTLHFLPIIPAAAGQPPLDRAVLAATLRVEHLAMYL